MIAGQFSRGKELREHEFYYETIALLILVGKKLGQSPSHKYRSSTKCKALFGFNSVFFVFVFTSIGTKKGRIFIRGAPQSFGGQLPQTAPPGSATACGITSATQRCMTRRCKRTPKVLICQNVEQNLKIFRQKTVDIFDNINKSLLCHKKHSIYIYMKSTNYF